MSKSSITMNKDGISIVIPTAEFEEQIRAGKVSGKHYILAELIALKEITDGIDLDRLREICKAERAGRADKNITATINAIINGIQNAFKKMEPYLNYNLKPKE